MSIDAIATYRLQLRPEFGFAEAAAVVPYLARLGVSHVYLSPFLQAGTGSTHGYDVVDPRQVNAELGGEEGYTQLCRVLREHRLAQLVDVVPNHMSIAEPERNPWWWDVLENGPASVYAGYFDVDWQGPESRLRDRVLVPILGDHYGRVLEAGEIRLDRRGAAITVRVYDRQLPLAPISLAEPLARAAAECGSDALAFLADAFAELPSPSATDPESLQRRRRDRAVLATWFERLVGESTDVSVAVEHEVARINASVADLHELLERQNYRLAYWRTARQDLDYRRFFDINELAALRVENPVVFAAIHEWVLARVRSGDIDGLRIDHPDGLRDPQQYFARLRDAAPQAWIVVEKILAAGETLRDTWPVSGTTGYDFLNVVGGLFVDGHAERDFDRTYAEFLGRSIEGFEDVACAKKGAVLRELLGSDVARLTEAFVRVCEADLDSRDFRRDELRGALEAVLARLPVYRAYVRGDGTAADEDRAIVARAVEAARPARPDLDGELFDKLAAILDGRDARSGTSELRARFQQLSATVTAKGEEDTAFYSYLRLACLNEVGGDPGVFGTPADAFHEHCLRIARDWPRTLTTLTTHDTKRSEDARLRIAALTEIPERWRSAVLAWGQHNARHRTHADVPDRGSEYLLYQTLVGTWPIDAERLIGFLRKAAREAKERTSWTRIDEEYERGLEEFCRRVMADATFVATLEELLRTVVPAARLHSLAQRLLQLVAPGIPDIYQGTELWDESLTDPDNRREVDFRLREGLLARIEGTSPEEASSAMEGGFAKLWLIAKTLRLRRRLPEAFGAEGGYESLRMDGPERRRAIGCVRGGIVAAVVPRFQASFKGEWKDTRVELPPGRWADALGSGVPFVGATRLAELWRAFPVALLEKVT